MSAFRTQRLIGGSFWDRLLGREAPENGFIKINNLLAQQHHVYDTPKQDMYQLIDQYNIYAKKKSGKNKLIKLYGRLFLDTLGKPHLFTQRLRELKFLKDLFSLSDKDVHKVHLKAVQHHYQQDLDELLSMEDGSPINEGELAFLKKVRNTLQVPEKLIEKIKSQSARRILEHVLQPSTQDASSLNSEDQALFDALHHILGITVRNKPTYVQLHKYCLYYCIENDKMPQLPPPPLGAHKNESCYLNIKAEWYERKRKVRYVHYGGLSLHVKNMQGMYWRTPLEEPRSLSNDVWYKVDSGDLYLTSKNLILVGEKKLHVLPLHLLSNFTGYENGIEVQKKTGTGIFFRIHFHTDLVALLLGKVLEER